MTDVEPLVYFALASTTAALILAGFVPYKGSLLHRLVTKIRDARYKRQWLKRAAYEHRHPIVLRREP